VFVGECVSHSLLASNKLAPPLLARFNNGIMYRFMEGKVSSPEDLRRPEIYRGVARRLAEWHASLPISAVTCGISVNGHVNGSMVRERQLEGFTTTKPTPNIWTVLQKWILALPNSSNEESRRNEQLRRELKWLYKELGDTKGIADNPLVFGHCDLLSGNVIIQQSPCSSPPSSSPSSPTPSNASSEHPIATVDFIDYEYATPTPAAFDIANHFAEWGGFDCDYSVLPTCAQRRDFLTNYLASYNSLLDRAFHESEVEQLFEEVDLFRGVPGFYWGIWALIQTTISQINFDYASYAEMRLGEYWAWKETHTKTRRGEVPLRESRWTTEED
jgi:ethanolamine kinase